MSDFKFKLRDGIHISELNRPGTVTGVLLEDAGVSYRIVYWNDGNRRTEWVYEGELELLSEVNQRKHNSLMMSVTEAKP